MAIDRRGLLGGVVAALTAAALGIQPAEAGSRPGANQAMPSLWQNILKFGVKGLSPENLAKLKSLSPTDREKLKRDIDSGITEQLNQISAEIGEIKAGKSPSRRGGVNQSIAKRLDEVATDLDKDLRAGKTWNPPLAALDKILADAPAVFVSIKADLQALFDGLTPGQKAEAPRPIGMG
jgi:hypothetical protein